MSQVTGVDTEKDNHTKKKVCAVCVCVCIVSYVCCWVHRKYENKHKLEKKKKTSDTTSHQSSSRVWRIVIPRHMKTKAGGTYKKRSTMFNMVQLYSPTKYLFMQCNGNDNNPDLYPSPSLLWWFFFDTQLHLVKSWHHPWSNYWWSI